MQEPSIAIVDAFVQCPQLISKYVGDSEAAVRMVFRTARQLAPCVLVLDELDTIASNRESAGAAATVKDRMLSTLLNELDGVGERSAKIAGSAQQVLVVGTSTDLRYLDAALLRSGRLDLHVDCHSPSREDIGNIFRGVSGCSRGALVEEAIDRCASKGVSSAQMRELAERVRLISAESEIGVREMVTIITEAEW
jgi:transitional endoplasmic reticulum ATPase